MKNPSFSLLVVATLGLFGLKTAGAQIIFDDFTGTNGTPLSSHSPNVNATGNPWVSTASSSVTIQGDTLQMGGFGNGAINISSNGGYVKPPLLTIAADINIDQVNTSNVGRAWDGVGLGYFSSLSTVQSFWNFTGLLLKHDGSLTLIRYENGQYSPTIFTQVAYVGLWDPTVYHSLSYTVDTMTGGISSVTFDGASAPYSGLSTTLFTNLNTANAGLYLQGNDGFSNVANIENFSLTTVPEPTTLGLLFGAGALIWARRRRA